MTQTFVCKGQLRRRNLNSIPNSLRVSVMNHRADAGAARHRSKIHPPENLFAILSTLAGVGTERCARSVARAARTLHVGRVHGRRTGQRAVL